MLKRSPRFPWVSLSSPNSGPPDLSELWDNFNRKLAGLFGGGRRGPGGPQGPFEPQGGDQGPMAPRSAGIGVGVVAGVAAVLWLASGIYIVQEGQQAVVTTFGSYTKTVDAGIQWRWPAPIQRAEVEAVTQLRSVEVGSTAVVPATGLRDSSMLTQDENIVDLRFTVQYMLKSARQFLYENRDTEQAVKQASESAVREIVGRSGVDSVLYERRDAIATELAALIQAQLDRLNAGVQVRNVNLQHVQVPEAVQAAFDDAVKAGADRDRFKNEGQAYASDVVPKAQGTAARLAAEAQGYRARVVDQARGDAQRFDAVVAEYKKAPGVTRDRLYSDTMREIYSNVSKVMVDTKAGSNLLYLPLDKLMAQSQGSTPTAPAAAPAAAGPAPTETPTVDARDRARDERSRERDAR